MSNVMPSSSGIAKYPVMKIVRCQMFRNGDVEYPIDECVDFVAGIVFDKVKELVNKVVSNRKMRKDNKVCVIDFIQQYHRNPKLLRRLFAYVSVINDSTDYGKVYDFEESSFNEDDNRGDDKQDDDDQSDDNYDSDSEPAESYLLTEKIIEAVNKLHKDGKLAKFIQSDAEDIVKTDRIRKIAARTTSMNVEKYRRFSEAATISFIHNRGRKSKIFDNGFRYYISASTDFDHDMLVMLNFVAIEMLVTFVEAAHKIRLRELGGIIRDWNKLGPIQLEHYQEAAQKITPPTAQPTKNDDEAEVPAKRQKIDST